MKSDSLGRSEVPRQSLLLKGVRFVRQNGLLAGVTRTLGFLRNRLRSRKHRSTRFLIDKEFDSELGVDTGGYLKLEGMDLVGSAASATAYQAMYPAPFRQVLEQLPICFDETVFIDFGSGKGRAVLLASAYPFAQLIGVEFAKELHTVATQNLEVARAKIKRPERIEFVCDDAGQAKIPLRPVLAFFNNPFGDAVMAKVAENLRRSHEIQPRDIWIVYFWPQSPKTWENSSYEEISIKEPDWPTATTERVVRVWRLKGP
jgi:hypothetical protein